MRNELQRQITQTSQRLIRHLKSKDRRQAKVQKHCDVITAILQAASLKRRKLIFSLSVFYKRVDFTHVWVTKFDFREVGHVRKPTFYWQGE